MRNSKELYYYKIISPPNKQNTGQKYVPIGASIQYLVFRDFFCFLRKCFTLMFPIIKQILIASKDDQFKYKMQFLENYFNY